MNFLKLLLLFFTLIIIHSEVKSQCLFVSGSMKDHVSGGALQGASIYAKGKNIGTISNVDGRFSLAAVALGDSLIVTFVGYENKTVIITDCVLNIALVPFQKNIAEVIISADKLIAEEFSTRKISKIEIYTNPSAKADPLLAVNAMPSSTTTDESANKACAEEVRMKQEYF
jgi:hypothetical protein